MLQPHSYTATAYFFIYHKEIKPMERERRKNGD